MYKNPEANPLEFVERSLELSRRFDSDRLRCFGIKIHPEGNWTSRTSLMLEPYEGTTTTGAAGVKADRLEQVIVAANDKELDVVVHSDGSATIRATIDAIAASIKRGNTSSRNALHHLFWTHPDDLDRILDMNIPVNVTPLFSTDWTGQDLLARQRLGEARTAEQFAAYPKIVANGNRVSLSADVPSSPLEHVSPLFNMQTAMTLRDPSNADSVAFPPGRSGIALDAAIRAVTIDAAWQIRMEDRIGSIEPGKYADLVILDDNLFDVDPSAIADVAVYETIMGGRTTYSGR